MKQCSRCWLPLPHDRRDNYCQDCRSEYARAYQPWLANGKQGRVLPPYSEPKRGPKPVRKTRADTGSWAGTVPDYVCVSEGPQTGQHVSQMSMKERYDLFNRQNGECALCRTQIRFFKQDQSAGAVSKLDNDHQPPHVIRGYLCSSCSRGIEMLQDDPDLLQAASNYVRHYRETDSPGETA